MGPKEQAAFAAGVLAIPALTFFLTTGGGGADHGNRVVHGGLAFELPEGWRYDVFEGGGIVRGPAGEVLVRLDAEPTRGTFDPARWERIVVDGEPAYRSEAISEQGFQRQIVFPGGDELDFRAPTDRLGQALPAFDRIVESLRVLD